jgi:hypothetical protein
MTVTDPPSAQAYLYLSADCRHRVVQYAIHRRFGLALRVRNC